MTLHRQRPFVSNGGIESASRPDVLLVDEQSVVIVELKLGEAGEAEFAQLERYLRNEHLITTFPGRQRRGLLVADRFQPGINQRAAQRSDVTFMRYSQISDGTLVLNAVLGDDVLAPFC